MKKLIVIFLVILLSSCLTEKRIQRNCNKFANVCIQDKISDTIVKTIIKDTTIYRDTVVFKQVVIKGETKFVRVLMSDTAKAETEFAKAVSFVSNGEIVLRLIQKDTVLNLRINLEKAIKERDFYKEIIKQIETQVVIKQTIWQRIKSNWSEILAWFLVGVLLIDKLWFENRK